MTSSTSIEISISCESVRKGCTFLARTYHLESQQFYSGTGATALEAIAWCLDDYLARTVYGFEPSPALPSDATPGSRFRGLSPRPRAVSTTPASASSPPQTTPAAPPRKRGKKKAA